MTLTPPVRLTHGAAKIVGGNLTLDRDIADSGIHGSLTDREVVLVIAGVPQDRAFQRGKFGRAAPPRTRDIDVDVVRDAAVLDDQHAVGQRDRFGDVMRDQDRGKGLIVPDPLQQPLHRNPRQRIERAERLVERQHARIG